MMSQLWRISVQRLGRNLSEASELASVFQEVAPDLQVGAPGGGVLGRGRGAVDAEQLYLYWGRRTHAHRPISLPEGTY
jgi:hypothetical protein